MRNNTPTQKEIRDYCREAYKDGCLTEQEYAQISEWLPFHPDWEPHWQLCWHGKPNQQGGYGMCVFGDGQHWPTSYYKLKSSPEAARRRNLYAAFRNAIRPDRDQFLAKYPDGYQADHANTGGFKAIVDAFLSEHAEVHAEYDAERGEYMLNQDIENEFRQHHNEMVCWKALTPAEHQRITNERRKAGSAVA